MHRPNAWIIRVLILSVYIVAADILDTKKFSCKFINFGIRYTNNNRLESSGKSIPSNLLAKITDEFSDFKNTSLLLSNSPASNTSVLHISFKFSANFLSTLLFGTRNTLFFINNCNSGIIFFFSDFSIAKSGKINNFLPILLWSQLSIIGNFFILEIPVILSNSPLFPKVADISILCFALENALWNIVGGIHGLIWICLLLI